MNQVPAVATLSVIAVAYFNSDAVAQGPSFNCSKASTPVELTICASDSLSRLDQEMANIYQNTRNQLGNSGRQRLLDEQRVWLSERNACGSSEPCLAQQMENRIAAIGSAGTRSREGSNEMPPELTGFWKPYSKIASQDGLQLSARTADFGIQGRYEIEQVRPGGHVFRITGRSEKAVQLMCGYDHATYVTFMPAGKPVVGSGELLEYQYTAKNAPLPDPDPSNPMQFLPGSCSMGYYIRR